LEYIVWQKAKRNSVGESSIKSNRKFKAHDFFARKETPDYFLLPFRFHKLHEAKEILVNEVGDYLIVPSGTAERIITRQLSRSEELYEDLVANFFISEEKIPPLLNVLATRYRTKKSFLDNFTALHIFVITLRCEHTCHYCQVSRVTQDKNAFNMQRAHIDKGIDFMMRSPNPNVTMEFQGGEALLAFDDIVYAVEKAEGLAIEYGKNITYVICTNLAPLTDEMLDYCRDKNILISTSLDGPASIHNQNRRRPQGNSYELAIGGIKRCRDALGHDRVSALLTTTALSLEHADEIVDEYFGQDFRGIFLRPSVRTDLLQAMKRKTNIRLINFLSFTKRPFVASSTIILRANFIEKSMPPLF
jgi:sulfatase maturation enzyme AslB (radical SAM superfamily)